MCGEQDKAMSLPIFPPSDSVHTHGQAKGRMPSSSSLFLGCFSDVAPGTQITRTSVIFSIFGVQANEQTVSGQAK